MKVLVDKEKCIGCGACTSVCDNFEMKDGKAVAKEIDSEDVCNQEATDICPVNAITIR